MARGKMWFGTFHHAEYIDCPVVGSDFSPAAWGSGGTYLSGGGFESGSPDAHKESNLSWSSASTIPAAARLQAYRDGAYSKSPQDLFYFHDPLSYSVNVLPKRWAQPSLLARSKRPWATEEVDTPAEFLTRGAPLTGAVITGLSVAPTEPGPGALYIPIPEGMTLAIGAMHAGGSNGPGYVPSGGGTRVPISSSSVVYVSDVPGILLYFQGEAPVYAMRAVLYKTGTVSPMPASTWEWHSGMGHSGSRFTTPPTYVPSNGVAGGMASYSATFREVGDWLQ